MLMKSMSKCGIFFGLATSSIASLCFFIAITIPLCELFVGAILWERYYMIFNNFQTVRYLAINYYFCNVSLSRITSVIHKDYVQLLTNE